MSFTDIFKLNFNFKGSQHHKTAGILFSFLLSCLFAFSVFAGELKIHYIDVGQGDAALLQCDGHNMLIDGGGREASSLIYTYLKNNGVTHLDYIIATHADEDHIGGLSGALNYATVDTAYCSVNAYDTQTFDSFVKYLGKQGKSITVPLNGTEFSLGSAAVRLIGPVSYSSESNNNSIVARVTNGNNSFLFTGDAEAGEEADIIRSGAVLKSDVLKVAHHGSNSSCTSGFLSTVQPQYAIISVGKGNSYGHPAESTLSALSACGAGIYRTDLQGDIICISDGTNISFTTEKQADQSAILTGGSSGSASDSSSGSATAASVSAVNNASAGAAAAAASGAVYAAAAGSSDSGYAVSSGSSAADTSSRQYILNTNTKKFHYPDCSSVQKMKDKNKKEYTGTRDESIAMGYEPCGNCHP